MKQRGTCAACGKPIHPAECSFRELEAPAAAAPRRWHPMCLPRERPPQAAWSSGNPTAPR